MGDENNHDLFAASLHGHLNKIKQLVEEKQVDINMKDPKQVLLSFSLFLSLSYFCFRLVKQHFIMHVLLAMARL